MEASTETIGVKAARTAIAADEAEAIDVRSLEEWGDGHVPGAIQVPEDRIDSQLETVSKDRKLIVIGDDQNPAAPIAQQLCERGYDAVELEGGMQAWKDADYTLQPSRDPDPESEIAGG